MNLFSQISLRYQLCLLVILCFIPAFGLILYNGYEHRDREYQSAELAAKISINNLASNINLIVDNTKIWFSTLSHLQEVRNLDKARLDSLLSEELKSNPHFAALIVTDKNGLVVGSAIPNKTYSVADRPYFQVLLQTKSFTIGEYALSRATGLPSIHFAYPVTNNNNELSGVIVGALKLDYLKQLAIDASRDNHNSIIISDRNGTRLVRHPPLADRPGGSPVKAVVMERIKQKAFDAIFLDKDDQLGLQLVAFKALNTGSLSEPYMNLHIRIPYGSVTAVANHYMKRSILLLLCAIILSILAAWLFGNTLIVRHIKTLVSATENISYGNLGHKTGVDYNNAEIGALAEAFDKMSISLAERDSKQKDTEMALQVSEKRFREFLECIQAIAVFIDKDERVSYCNNYLTLLTGWSREEIIGSNWFDMFVPVEERDERRHLFITQSLTDHLAPHQEKIILTKSGERLILHLDVTTRRDNNNKIIGTASIGHDVTEFKILEERYRHAQKMEAVGQLAGGIAHDFNNFLQVIAGYSDLILNKLVPTQFPYKEVNRISEAANRAASLVKQLLTFSRRKKLDCRPLDLSSVVLDMTEMLPRLLRENIQLTTDITTGLETIFADQTQLQQVLMNLSINARDAMPNGGTITIRTANVNLNWEFVRAHTGTHVGKYALLSISDTGKGIPAEIRNKIFDPFFTTKSIGTGTGLGLATVYAIVKQHQGFIDIDTEINKGTTFSIFFPVIDISTTTCTNNENDLTTTSASGTILVAEDEESVRNLTVRVLTNVGYNVIVAKDGNEALEKYQQHKDKIDLFLFDVVMPGKSGKDVFEIVLKESPEAKALFLSGYSFDAFKENAISMKNFDILEKPFAPKRLVGKIQKILGHDQTSLIKV